jgi:putative transposase
MSDTQIVLKAEHYYHIYNHAVGNENLFDTDKDYAYFLSKLKEYIFPVSELLAYCLMPNHFHLIFRIKKEDDIKYFVHSNLKGHITVEELIKKNENYLDKALSQIFSNFFNTYIKYYNFHKNRTGSLFKRAFRRKEIEDLEYLRTLICYVHQNPVEAGIAKKPDDWKYSSYRNLIGLQPTLIPGNEIINLFGDLQNFIYCHLKRIVLEKE